MGKISLREWGGKHPPCYATGGVTAIIWGKKG